MKGQSVINAFEWLAKFTYALFPSVLPYSTPIPIAVMTAFSAETFFNLPPFVAGVFVFSLEGLGVWSTTTFVDKFVEWIRSRNPKVLWMAVIMAAVVLAYLVILVLLNVVLKGDNTAEYKFAVFLICFLPFIAGVLNGFRKVDLADKDAALHREELAERDAQRTERREARELRMMYRAQTKGEAIPKKVRWTDLNAEQRRELKSLTPDQIMAKYPGTSNRTARNWKHQVG